MLSARRAAWWLGRAVLAATVAAALVPASAAAAGQDRDNPATAVTDSGVVRGVQTDRDRQFLGIPYAAAPVGDLRWRPPQPPPGWQGVRQATAFGSQCPQPGGPFGRAGTDEDCLYLNVFTPRHRRQGSHRLPVMVWIHGGALVTGEGSVYNPVRLVEQDVVVVTINYRLGALGFLAHPALTAESPEHASGNYGLMDQQAALRWVARNIRHFGGDPNQVTIFGESAGGLSVHSQLVSPLAQGLFHRAIVQSGAYQLTQPSLAAAQSLGSDLATRSGCASQTAACLRGIAVQSLLANQTRAIASPVVDGFVLTDSIGASLAAGTFNKVPVIEGSNHDEWALFVAQTEVVTGQPLAAADYIAAIQSTLGVSAAAATALAAAYPLSAYPSPSLALTAVGTDAIFACNARRAAGSLSAHVPTFQYEFNDPDAPNRFFPGVSFPTRAYHAAELQYLFDAFTAPPPAFTPQQRQLAQTMVRYWTQFARLGDPNSPSTPNWPRYRTTDQMFQALVPGTSFTATGFAADHKCALFGG